MASGGCAARGIELATGAIVSFARPDRCNAVRKRNLELLLRSRGVVEIRHHHTWQALRDRTLDCPQVFFLLR